METVHKKLLGEWSKEPKVLTAVNNALKQAKVISFKSISDHLYQPIQVFDDVFMFSVVT